MRDNWEVLHKKANEIITNQVSKEVILLGMMQEQYSEAKSIRDYNRIGLTIRKITLKIERLKSTDYFYKLVNTLEGNKS